MQVDRLFFCITDYTIQSTSCHGFLFMCSSCSLSTFLSFLGLLIPERYILSIFNFPLTHWATSSMYSSFDSDVMLYYGVHCHLEENDYKLF